MSTYQSAASTLLYVEDDPDAAKLFELALRDPVAQLHLQLIASVQHAMDYLSGNSPCSDRNRCPMPKAILLDYSLGPHACVDLIWWIREKLVLQTEVAVFSASDAPEQVTRSYKAGADYYLVKPSQFDRLVHIAREIQRGFQSNRVPCLTRLVLLPEYRPSRLTVELTATAPSPVNARVPAGGMDRSTSENR